MRYIELTQDDLLHIDNRAVICWYGDKFVIYEPIPLFLEDYFKNRERKEVVIPDITITKVEYNWSKNKAHITIADGIFKGTHEFDCNEEWTTTDCENAIKSKFGVE